MQENLYREALLHFNEPILLSFELGRCVGYAEDEDDCYLMVKMPYGRRHGMVKHTFVGGYIYLDCLKTRGVVQSLHTDEVWTDFSRLDSLLQLNGASREAAFLVDVTG